MKIPKYLKYREIIRKTLMLLKYIFLIIKIVYQIAKWFDENFKS